MFRGLIFAEPGHRPAPPDPGLPTGASAAAFAIDEPVSIVSPVVFASPHSGRHYPQAFLDACCAPMLSLRRIEDAFVDRLLSDVHAAGAPVIMGLVGRACVDLNRADTEMDPSMFADPAPAWSGLRSPRVDAGLGCLPRVAFNGAPIYSRRLTRREAEVRLDQIYRPYHRALDALLRRAQAMFGQAWLVDVHSMPADAETGGKAQDRAPDIVIGDRYGASCDAVFADRVEELFRERGYSTARNAPYAGGYATLTHGQPLLGRHAVQIEIRRSLYLDEARVEPHEGFLTLRRNLSDIAREIAAWTTMTATAGSNKNSSNTKGKAAPKTGAAKVLGRKRP